MILGFIHIKHILEITGKTNDWLFFSSFKIFFGLWTLELILKLNIACEYYYLI